VAASILEITSVATAQGEAMLNRWHFVREAGDADVSAVLAAFVTNVIEPYQVFTTPSVQWTELLYRVITNPLSPQGIHPINPAAVGSNSGEMVPSFACVTARWALGASVILTAESPQRRVRRGAKHFGGFTEDHTEGNMLVETAVHFYEAVCEGYLGMSDAGYIPCVVGFPKRAPHVPGAPSVPQAPPNKYALITGFTINRVIGSEVSRKVGHGN
jgi:hypothetical protein